MQTPTPQSSIEAHGSPTLLLEAPHLVVEETRFLAEPSPSLFCPICQDLFSKPVITPICFHTFCRACLQLALSHEPKCPMCRAEVEQDRLMPNLLVASMVSELRVRCQNEGCEWQGSFGNLEDHERGSCARREVECIHLKGGCKWRGAFCELPVHVLVCPFEVFKDYMKGVADEMGALRSQVALLQLQMKFLQNQNVGGIKSGHDVVSSPRSMDDGKGDILEDEVWRKERLDSVERLECKHTKVHHSRNVTSLALGDGGFFFSASHDKQICMWDTETCDLKHIFSGNKSSVWALAYMDNTLYSSSEGSLTAWHVPTATTLVTSASDFKFHGSVESKTYCLVPDNRSQLLFSGNYKTICIWDKNSREFVSQISAHDDCVWSLSFQEDLLVSGSDDGTVKLWDLRKLDCPIKTFEAADSRFLSVTAGAGFIFGGTQQGHTHVWSASTLQHVTSLRGHQWDVWQLAFINGFLCSGSYDHTIKIWDSSSLSCIKTLTGHRSNIYALKAESLHSHGAIRLISGSGDKTIKIWEPPPLEHRASSSHR